MFYDYVKAKIASEATRQLARKGVFVQIEPQDATLIPENTDKYVVKCELELHRIDLFLKELIPAEAVEIMNLIRNAAEVPEVTSENLEVKRMAKRLGCEAVAKEKE